MLFVEKHLQGLVADEIAAVDRQFRKELSSDLSPINTLVTHVEKFRGKMLRPLLLLLAGRATETTAATNSDSAPRDHLMTDDHITLATVVEMVHMASLVHDDILDGAEIRRRGATINHLHGNETAVLLGDFLISHAYHLCSSLDSQTYARIVAHTTNTVCEGEMLQNLNRRNWELDEKTYFSIIYRKTAALTEACCRLGAMVSTERQNWVAALGTYGKSLGLAFQIIDDVLDITGQQQIVGKSLGTDIEKGKLTLPLIHFLHTAAPQHRELLIHLLESPTADRIENVRQLIGPSDSIAHAQHRAEQLIDEAITALQVLPQSEARDGLTELARFVTARDR
jgi:octaprenyl-diphosphate synthase